MRRGRRLALAAAVIALLLLAGEILLESIGFDRYRRFVERQLSDALGLEVVIHGDFHSEAVPTPRFEATEVTVANLPGRPSPHLLEIGTLTLEFDRKRLLRGAIEVGALSLRDAELRIETDAEGGFGLAHRLDSLADEPPGDPDAFHLRRVDAKNLRVVYRAGGSGAVTTAHVEALSLDADDVARPVALAARGEINGRAFDVTGELGPIAELLAPTAPYPFAIRGQVGAATTELKGSVDLRAEPVAIDAAFSAELPGLTGVAQALDWKLPAVGPVTVSARIANPQGTLAVEDFRIETTGPEDIRAALTGSVRDLAAFRGVAFELHLDADDARFLRPLVERSVHWRGSFTADATASDAYGSLGIAGAARATGREGHVSLELAGELDDLSHFDQMDLELRLRARDLAALAQAFELDLELPALGPVTARGKIRSHSGALGIDSLTAEVGRRDETWVEVVGSVEDLLRFRGVDLTAEFGASDLRHLRTLLDREPPDLGPIRGHAVLTDLDGTLGVERFHVRGGREGVLEFQVAGELDHALEIDEIELDARLEARDLEVVGEVFGIELPPIGPIEFAGHVRGSDERIDAERVVLRLDETRFYGELSGSFVRGARPRLNGRVRSPRLRLMDIGIEPRPREQIEEARRERALVDDATRRERSGDAPLPFERLRALDAAIELRADRVTGSGGFELSEVRASIVLDEGELAIERAGAVYYGGTATASLRVDARAPVPRLTMHAAVAGVDVRGLMAQFEKDTNASGLMDAAADLESRGSSWSEIRSELSGHFASVIRDGTFSSGYERAFVTELARVSLPWVETSEVPEYDCFVADFEIEDGIARVHSLLLEADNIRLDGAGAVDIGRDQFDLTLTPRVEDPALFTVAATVTVSGSLTSPVFTPMRHTIVTSVARSLLDNAIRPARRIAQRLLGDTGRHLDASACDRAIGPRLQPGTVTAGPPSEADTGEAASSR